MIKLPRAAFAVTAFLAWAGLSRADTISCNIADYNAADERTAHGVLTVPAGVAIYSLTSSTLMVGSTVIVTLPSNFTFGSAPSLTDTGTATFTLISGGVGARSATFTVGTAPLVPGQSFVLSTFTVDGAAALGTVTPVANALPLTIQAGASSLSCPAFASSQGATAVFVGAIQFIDVKPPSNATEFLASPDTLTAVISAIAIQSQSVDTTETVPILSSNGSLNSLSPSDTATVTITGNFRGIARAYASTTSDCLGSFSNGSVNLGSIVIPNIPINREEFFCLTGSGAVLGSDPNGFTSVTVAPGTSTDFLSAPVNIEFPGLICYNNTGGFACDASYVPPPLVVPTPALSEWAMIGLAGIMLLFGVRTLKARTTP